MVGCKLLERDRGALAPHQHGGGVLHGSSERWRDSLHLQAARLRQDPNPNPNPDPNPDPTPDPNPAHSKVFTLEITELGFSMLAWPAGPPTVFGALLESCLADTGATPEEETRVRSRTARGDAAAAAQNGGAASWSIDTTAAGKRQCLPGGEVGNGPPSAAARGTTEGGASN